MTVLEEGNFVWNLWVDPPFPIYTDFYLFNCTNYEDVVRNGAKPVVVEVGPYSYRYRKITVNGLELNAFHRLRFAFLVRE